MEKGGKNGIEIHPCEICAKTFKTRKEMKNVMGPDTKYITMLRDPVDLFESAYVYYRMISSYNMTLGKSRDTAASLFKKTKNV